MGRLVLVDAYNALFRLGGVPEDRDVARSLLLRRAAAALRGAPVKGGIQRLHLVFDTLPGATRAGLRSRDGRVSWHHVAGSADDAILDHLRRHQERRSGPSILVVTDDRELAGRARQLGARTMGVRAFFDAAPTDADPELSRRRGALGPPMGARDFNLPDGPIDLDDPGSELL